MHRQRASRLRVAASKGAGLPLWLAVSLAGCGVVPIQDTPAPPPRVRYAGPHAKPLAYGGGVCAVTYAHEHSYPPVPRAAFESTPDGLVDTRARYPYVGMHAHHGRTCFREEWHMHTEPPTADLGYSRGLAAYTAEGDVPLVAFSGRHPPRPCDAVACTETRPHGHVACALRARPEEVRAARERQE